MRMEPDFFLAVKWFFTIYIYIWSCCNLVFFFFFFSFPIYLLLLFSSVDIKARSKVDTSQKCHFVHIYESFLCKHKIEMIFFFAEILMQVGFWTFWVYFMLKYPLWGLFWILWRFQKKSWLFFSENLNLIRNLILFCRWKIILSHLNTLNY